MNMKASKFYILLVCAVLFPLFTSCIDDGENKYEVAGGGVGLIEYNSGKTMLRTSAGGLWYSPEMDLWTEYAGTPVLVYFIVDMYNQPSDKYWTIQLSGKAVLPKYPVSERIILEDDFTYPMDFSSQSLDSVETVKNVWLLYPEIKFQTGQEMSYELVYLAEETNDNLFTFYLKSKKIKDGSGANKQGPDVTCIDMNDFIYREGTTTDRSELKYTLKYVSEADEDGSVKYKTLLENKVLWKRK